MKTPGVLVTHNAFTYHFGHWGRDKITGYYESSMRKSGCTASAIITKVDKDDEVDKDDNDDKLDKDDKVNKMMRWKRTMR